MAIETLRRLSFDATDVRGGLQSAAAVDFAFQDLSSGRGPCPRPLAIAQMPNQHPALAPQIAPLTNCNTALVMGALGSLEPREFEQAPQVKAAEGWARLFQVPERPISQSLRAPDREKDERVVVKPRSTRRVVMKIVRRSRPGPNPILD